MSRLLSKRWFIHACISHCNPPACGISTSCSLSKKVDRSPPAPSADQIEEEEWRRRRRYVPPDPVLDEGSWKRASTVMRWDMANMYDLLRGKAPYGHDARVEGQIFPQFCDICVIGGGIMGSLIAYFIKQRCVGEKNLRVVVVEKDPSYAQSASTNSFGAVRVQFSQEHNIKAALYGAEFLRRMKEHLAVFEKEPGDLQFQPQGYLFLGSEADVAQLKINHETQIKCGAKVALLLPHQLAERYPWLNLDGIALASYGLEHEGWLDTWKYLYALKEKNMSMGVHYVDGEVVEFRRDDFAGSQVATMGGVPFEKWKWVRVRTKEHGDQHIQFCFVVNAAGADSGTVAKLADVGQKRGTRIIPLPVEKRKRYMYAFHCPEGPKLSMPMLVDPNGLNIRRDGIKGMYICGWTPKTNEEEPDPNDLTVKNEFFYDVLWPKLSFRIPVFSKLELRGGWYVHYDYNYFDQSGILGPHVYHGNMLFACGFSGYGMAVAPGYAKTIMDYIYEAQYEEQDVTPYEFERLLHFEPQKEIVLV
ncbi:FAD-dependent oxidoreductase domain-containing protein 1-like [Paramacrobiotus metropolitanus]|uniref:FAD-dependent oxidoreductase domain-containing protein 1-like n=1 Tax=Paramacrobiotus metropolitanus TaxID=2943436 RepID=UPI002446432D|nr:FAD-dependent oxidoreductase domain-containing protein 1-like [Paramacrobiotus metropolitanus]